eukprot:scaffold3044_cov176-Ochromonas_danica.AAC.10
MEEEQAAAPTVTASATGSSDHVAKIKKRAPVEEEERSEGEEEEEGEVTSPPAPISSPDHAENNHVNNIRQQESKARKDLIDFLTRKGVDAKAAEDYQIHVRQNKMKSRRHSYGGRGSLGGGGGAAGSGGFVSREDAYERAHQHLLERTAEDSFPLVVGDIIVHNLGQIDSRSGFHSAIQIYPVGYRCEQSVQGTTYYKGTTTQKIICEIGDLDGYPEFRIIVPSTGTTFLASSESAVWKKYNPGNVDAEWDPSFFNLEVELLIEGLEHADECEDYHFHEESGYGRKYHTEAKRSKRTLDRQRAKHLTKEEQDRLAELQRRRSEEEKDLSKRLVQLEKEKKDQLREDFKKKKEEQREQEKREREEKKVLEARHRENVKAQEQERREQQRLAEKSMKEKQKKTVHLRKEVLAEVKRNRQAATMMVVEHFDAEEEVEEEITSFNSEVLSLLPSGSMEELLGGHADLPSFLRSLPSLPSLDTPPVTVGAKSPSSSSPNYYTQSSWDDLLNLANMLNLFKEVLGIDNKVDLLQLLAAMSAGSLETGKAQALFHSILKSTGAPTATTSSSNAAGSGDSETSNESKEEEKSKKEDSMEVVDSEKKESDSAVPEKKQADEEEEEEMVFDSPSHSPADAAVSSLLVNREAELDRIQLSITKLLLSSLHSLLDLDQKESGDSSGRKDKRLAAVRYPLNQLTWLELARMSCLNYLFNQSLRSHDDIRVKEDLQHLLRGSKQSSFRIAKNIVRNIRYRWYLRIKLPQEITQAKSIAYEEGVVDSMDKEDQLDVMANIIATRQLATTKNAKSTGAATGAVIYSGRSIYQNEVAKVEAVGDGVNERRGLLRPPINAFNTEQELLQTLTTVSEDIEHYSETYRRCCKVLIKILNTSAAKNLFWEVDQELYPHYYDTIIRPVMFTNVASNLVNRAYDHLLTKDDETTAEGEVTVNNKIAYEFYKDLQQVAINCFAYNSEISPIISQAQKLLQIIHRHTHRWLININTGAGKGMMGRQLGVNNYLPPVEYCSDKYCLLTHTVINYNLNDCIKCGKCYGCFNLTALEQIYQNASSASSSTHLDGQSAEVNNHLELDYYRQYYVHPTHEITTQVNEEWHCPFCLQEDSVLLYPQAASTSLTNELFSTPFFINEWGPSATVPWLFNPNHCQTITTLIKEQPFLLTIVDALQILANPTLSSFPSSSPGSENGIEVRSWTIGERVRVLMALAIICRETSSSCIATLNKLYHHCEKLLEHCNKTQFREADFISIVRKIAGDEGVIQCRNMLDGISRRAATTSSTLQQQEREEEGFLQALIREGRCIICNAFTFEDDNNNNGNDDNAAGGASGENNDPSSNHNNSTTKNAVILCDGCNAEVHLRCLHLTEVPAEEWYCQTCSERNAKREELRDPLLDPPDAVRQKAAEEALLNQCAEAKAEGLNPFLPSEDSGEGDDLKCQYCGFNEKELCSILVLGQSRAEHDAFVSCCQPARVHNVLGNKQKTNTIVSFYHEGDLIPHPTLSYPFFAKITGRSGKVLAREYEKSSQAPVIVHDLCAVNMFHARVNRIRHTLRRRRKAVGEKAITICGISVQPLGYDDNGFEYWKFPFSPDLFIAYDEQEGSGNGAVSGGKKERDQDRVDFEKLIRKPDLTEGSSSTTTSTITSSATTTGGVSKGKVWVRVSDLEVIKRIVACLEPGARTSSSCSLLRKNLINNLLADRLLGTSSKHAHSDDTSSSNDKEEEAKEKKEDEKMEVEDQEEGEDDRRQEDDEDDEDDDEDHRSAAAKKDALAASSSSSSLLTPATTPVALQLLVNKGQDISSSYHIQEEQVFEEDDTNHDDAQEEEEEGNEASQYFTFSKRNRYYAIGLMNHQMQLVKMGNLYRKVPLKVVSQIHREGLPTPLSYAELTEPWTDHLYYFSSIQFKKSGRYYLSFLVEGSPLAGQIPPLIYPVTVTANRIRCGISDAVERLIARQHLTDNNRQITSNRRELLPYTHPHSMVSGGDGGQEAAAVKGLLLTVFLALPLGCLVMDNAAPASSSSSELLDQMLEPSGWNPLLEQAWRGAVLQSDTPLSLMECVLVLEFYLQRAWLGAPAVRLLQSLPNAHFAVRCATYSSIALRIFCLDKAILYEKVTLPPRERRGATGGSVSYNEEDIADYPATSRSRSERYASRGSSGEEVAANSGKRGARGRAPAPVATVSSARTSRRTAAAAASARIHTQSAKNRDDGEEDEEEEQEEDEEEDDEESSGEGDDDDDDEDNDGSDQENDDDDEAGVKTANSGPSDWYCPSCSARNEPRARSCSACGERKPPAAAKRSVEVPSRGGRQSSRGAVGKRTRQSASASHRPAPVQRKRRRISRDDDDDDDDSEEAEFDDNVDFSKPRRGRGVDDSDEEDEQEQDVEEEEEEEQDDDDEEEKGRKLSLRIKPRGPSYAELSSEEEEFDDVDGNVKRKKEDEDDEEEEAEEEEADGVDEEDEKEAGSNDSEDDADYTRSIPRLVAAFNDRLKASQAGLGEDNLRSLAVLRQLLQDARSESFWKPVDLDAFPNYSIYVDEPMDLGTVTDRIYAGYYTGDVEKVAQDIRLVWSNCISFNDDQSVLYGYAQQ